MAKTPEKNRRSKERNSIRREHRTRTKRAWVKRGSWEEQLKLNGG